jgi:hypothetical protein
VSNNIIIPPPNIATDKCYLIGVRKIVKNGCLSRTMLEAGRRNKPHNFQSSLHPPTHTACPPPRVGLPLACNSKRKPSLTQPRQSQPACRVRLSAVLAQAGMQTGRSYLSPFGSSATPFVCPVKKFTFQWGVPAVLKRIENQKKKVTQRYFNVNFNRR